jgi:hypothetical protein
MARVTLRAAAPRPYSPGRVYGIPDRYPGLRPGGGTTRRTVCRDELPATITTVPLGINVAGAGGGVRRASAAPASAQVGQEAREGADVRVGATGAADASGMGPSHGGHAGRGPGQAAGRAVAAQMMVERFPFRSASIRGRGGRGGRLPDLRRGCAGDRSDDQLDDVPDAGVLAAGSSFGVGERAELAGRVVPDGWTRMTWPSLDSCTDAATMETSMAWRAHRRPAAYKVPAKLTTPTASADRLAPMPGRASFQGAAGLVIGGGTAYEGLVDRGRLQAGETVLITAAAGGVGSAAVQIAAALGARPLGVASPGNHDYLRGLGVSEVFEAGGGHDLVHPGGGEPDRGGERGWTRPRRAPRPAPSCVPVRPAPAATPPATPGAAPAVPAATWPSAPRSACTQPVLRAVFSKVDTLAVFMAWFLPVPRPGSLRARRRSVCPNLTCRTNNRLE